MLVVGRKKNDEIIIGDDIIVQVLDVRGSTVRLGVKAPEDVGIRRGELAEEHPVVSRGCRREGDVAEIEPPDETGEIMLPATSEIVDVISEETEAVAGSISCCEHDGQALYLWARLPSETEVRASDVVGAGIAVAAVGELIRVRHRVFRRVCRNGMIAPRVEQEQDVHRVNFAASSDAIAEVLQRVRDAIRLCAGVDGFGLIAEKVASTTQRLADVELDLIPGLLRMPAPRRDVLRAEITGRFVREGDYSLFGLLNAVTSTARDREDPDTRWRLEELGGAIACQVPFVPDSDRAAAVTPGLDREETAAQGKPSVAGFAGKPIGASRDVLV